MSNKFDPKIKTIMHLLHSRGFTIKGIRQGIRVKLENAIDVDIYTLKFDADKLRARLKLHIEDEKKRALILKHVSDIICDAFDETLEMEEFAFSRDVSGDYYYYARLFMRDTTFLVKPEERTEILVARKSTAETSDVSIDHRGDLQKVVAIMEKVDAKMFRTSLDELGISRTSILRVCLTRIFRSATGPDELKAVITEEAKRISDEEDRNELDNILTSNYVPFLDPIIRMLHQSVFDDSDLEITITG
jgi:hypothetical protein